MRGRKKIQEANELYKRGRYHEAVAAFEAAEALVPNLPTLWLNKGYTCRQLIAPGGRDPDSRRAAACALAAFRRLAELSPGDPRADQLTVQTWFDTDDFATLEKTFLERNRRAPDDYDVVHGLQEVYYKWGKWPQALEWSTRAAKLRPNDAEAQYGVGTFIWQMLASHGGGPDMAAYDPRPQPAPEDGPPGAAQARGAGEARDAARDGAAAAAPVAAPGDVTGKERARSGRPGDRAPREGGGAAPALRGRDDVPGARLAPEVVRAVRRPGRLAAGGRPRERVAEARAGRRGREELTDGVRSFSGAGSGAGTRAAASGSGTRSRSAFHGALIAAGVVYSFWHIEELSPPLLK